MKTMYGRYIDYNSYLYKLVYIITIKDEAHKNLLCVNDTLVDIDLVTDVNMPNLEPDSEYLNQLALEIIARSDKFKGFPVQLLHTELAIYRLLEDENGNERALGQHRTIAEASAVESPIRQETIGFPAHFFARAHNFKPPGRACQPEADSPTRI